MKNIFMITLVAMVSLLGFNSASAQNPLKGIKNLPTNENGWAVVYSEEVSVANHVGWERYLTLDAASRQVIGQVVRAHELDNDAEVERLVAALKAMNADRLDLIQEILKTVGVERVDGFSISVGGAYGTLNGASPEVGVQYTFPKGVYLSATGGYIAEKEVFGQVNAAANAAFGLGWRFRQKKFLAVRPIIEGYCKFEQYQFNGVTASGDLDYNNSLNTIFGVKAGLELPLNTRKGMTEGRKINSKLVFSVSYEFGEGTSYNGYISPEEYRGALETGYKPGIRVASVNQLKFSVALKFGQNRTQAKFK